MLRKYPKLFQDPKIDYPIYNLNLSFSDYIQQSEKIIASIRQDLDSNRELIIKNNAPFELKPDNSNPKCGALLIHGLLDSPFIMRDIGHYLQSQGLLVRSIMLPGHSTVPGALLNTQYDEWLQAVNYGIATLKQDVEKIFLVGYSTGASLSICNAIKDPAISGLIMFAPALKINSPFTFLSKWLSLLEWQRAKWFSVCEEIDNVKYQSVTMNSIYQVYKLSQIIQDAKQLTCPFLMILSKEDKIICSNTAINYFQQTDHPLNRALVYSAKPLTFSDSRIMAKKSSYPEMNILNFCHISLPVAPLNSHYGKEGDYVCASHIENNIRYGAFDKADIGFYDLLRKFKLTQYQYQRLTFNPDFDFMQSQIGDFIKNC